MSKRKILIADRDNSNLAILTNTLSAAGYTVITPTDTESLTDITHREKPDLAILGVDNIEERPDQPGLQTLYLITSDNPLAGELCLENGAMGYLLKPVDPHHLLPTIETALECADELRRRQINEDRLADAILSNREISLAIGIFMERFQTVEQEAFETLRSYARSERRKLVEVAREVIQVTEGRNALVNRISRAGNPNNKNQP